MYSPTNPFAKAQTGGTTYSANNPFAKQEPAEESWLDKVLAQVRGTAAAATTFLPRAIEGVDRGVGSLLEQVPGENVVSRAVRSGGSTLRQWADETDRASSGIEQKMMGKPSAYADAGYTGTRLPLELAKYAYLGPSAGMTVGAVENAGASPEHSTAALVEKLARKAGFSSAADALQRQGSSATGRAAFDVVLNLLTEGTLRAGSRALESSRLRSSLRNAPPPVAEPKALPAGQYAMGPATTNIVPETNPARLLPSRSATDPVATAGVDVVGPAIPSRAVPSDFAFPDGEGAATLDDIETYRRLRDATEGIAPRAIGNPKPFVGESAAASSRPDVHPSGDLPTAPDVSRGTSVTDAQARVASVKTAHDEHQAYLRMLRETEPDWSPELRVAEQQMIELKQELKSARQEQVRAAEQAGEAASAAAMDQFRVSTASSKQALDDAIDAARPPRGGPSNRAGIASPEVVTNLATTGIGAATGAAVDQENPQRGSVIGGTIGAGVGVGGRKAVQSLLKRPGLNEGLDRIVSSLRSMEPRVPGGAKAMAGGEARAATDIPLTPEAEALTPANRIPMMRRLDLSPDMQSRVASRVAQIESSIKRPVTWDEVREEAAKQLNTHGDKLAKLSPREMTGAQGLAIATMVRENVHRIETLSAKLSSVIDDAERTAISSEIEALDGQSNQLLTVLMKGATEQGRALNANKILANLTTDPTYWMLKAQRLKDGDVLTLPEKEAISSFLNRGDREGLVQYLASLRQTPWYQQIVTLRKAGFLTAIPGRMKDFLSTGANVLSEGVLQAPEAALDAIVSNVAARVAGGAASKYRTTALPSMMQWQSTLEGARKGLQEAGKLVGVDAFREGGARGWASHIRSANIDPAALSRLDIPRQTNVTLLGSTKANAILDAYQKLVFRAAGATDRFWRSMAYNGALVEQARLTAMREGLTGERLAQRAKVLMEQPTDEMVADAIAAADILTFNNDGTLAKAMSSAITSASQAAGSWGKLLRAAVDWVVPFRRTVANITTRVAEYAPVTSHAIAIKRGVDWWGKVASLALESKAGGVSAASLAEARHAQRQLVETLTRSTGGLGLVGLGLYLHQQGVMTGAAPTNSGEREQWRLEGRQPNSMLVNGEWIPVGQLAPLGSLLAVGANISSRIDSNGASVDKAGSLPFDIARTVLDQPMVTGVATTTNALVDPQGTTDSRWLRDQVGSFIPTGIAQVARSSGESKMPETLGQTLQSRIPGLADKVPSRLNIFGQPHRGRSGVFDVAINPLGGSQDKRQTDPIIAALAQAGVSVAPLVRHRKETIEQYQWRQRESGQWLHEDLTTLLQSPEYQQADQNERQRLIKDQVRRTRADFSKELREQFGIITTPE